VTRAAGAIVVAAAVIAVLGGLVVVDRWETASGPPAEPTPSPAPAETLAQQLERVRRIVAEVRELEFETPPEVTVVDPDELADRVSVEATAYTVEEADLDRRILELLGAIPEGTDLRGLLVTALSEQVAGFYDPETEELVVGAEDPTSRVGRIEEVTLAHELQHALADQRLGLPDLDDGDDDAVLARLALVEGDATVTMQAYVAAGFSPVDRLLVARESAELLARLDELTELPPYLERSLLFPYEEGASFVATLLEDGGWEAVDRAYADPPTTTAGILFPERYLAGAESTLLPVAAPDLPEPWTQERATTFGAADLLFLFEAPGGDRSRGLGDALALARAWRGGRLDLWTEGERSAVSIVVATDGTSLCGAVTTWLDRADPSARTAPATGDTAVVRGRDRQAVVTCAPDEVRIGISTDAGAAERLAARR
jgi:hypothetical protein